MKKQISILYSGLGILQNLKIATFLFSQLSKFGILIKTRVKGLSDLDSIDGAILSNYKFVLTDCCVDSPGKWKEHIDILPAVKFVLLYGSIDAHKLRTMQDFGFVFIQVKAFSISIIANQILNVISNTYSNEGANLSIEQNLKLQEKPLENIRVVLPNREFFILTKLANLGFLQYKEFSIKLSDLESTIMYDLVSSYKWADNSIVKFPLLNYRQVTNTISRLRNKLKLIEFPLIIKNDYARGYYLQFKR